MLGSNLYEHSFATLAFCEAFRQTKTDEAKKRAELALALLVRGQASSGEWGYSPCRHGDTSVTGACVQALRAARMAELEIPKGTLEKLRGWIESVTTDEGEAGYTDRSAGHGALTAIGLYTRRTLDPGTTVTDKMMPLAAKKVAASVGTGQFQRDLYLWYYAMLALFDFEGPHGASWKSVNEAVTTALVKSQHREDKCSEGAWDDDSFSQGVPFETAVCVLALETYYRYVDPPEKKPTASATVEKPSSEPHAAAAPK
jgi:hypothetical protein